MLSACLIWCIHRDSSMCLKSIFVVSGSAGTPKRERLPGSKMRKHLHWEKNWINAVTMGQTKKQAKACLIWCRPKFNTRTLKTRYNKIVISTLICIIYLENSCSNSFSLFNSIFINLAKVSYPFVRFGWTPSSLKSFLIIPFSSAK